MADLPPTHERINQRASSGSFVGYFILFMAVVYMGLGVFLVIAKTTPLNIPPTPQRLLGAVFLLYGIIRFVRNFRQAFPKKS